jgi:hypothetical protein
MRLIFRIIIIICVVSFCATACLIGLIIVQTNSIDTLATEKKVFDSIFRSIDKHKGGVDWAYFVQEGKNKFDKTYIARALAKNQLNLRFPNVKDVNASLHIVNQNGINRAFLMISRGQFIANSSKNQIIKIKFDQTKAEYFNCSKSNDISIPAIYINSVGRLISKLKKSKKIIIEAEVYHNGYQIMHFDVGGFKWGN